MHFETLLQESYWNVSLFPLFIISEMTEEQMLDLAVRMSEQEANQRHEEEEEALKKAIEESLCVITSNLIDLNWSLYPQSWLSTRNDSAV